MAILMAGLWGLALSFRPGESEILVSAGLFFALCVVNWFDFDHFRIPDMISYPLIGLGLLAAFVLPERDFGRHLAGAGLGFGLIWGINAYWRHARRQEGIGMGDAKLVSAAGAWLGVLALPLVTLVASGSALVFIGVKSALTQTRPASDQRISFGPFIALGFWTIWQFRSAFSWL